ncbi:MAG: rhomboid family intramembrane serine protease [Chitinophagaceae bacterium]|nr:rhomboid family intramembrane serine protease [Chitinophagaceae bacterium]
MALSITVIIIIITALVSFGAFRNEKLLNDLIFYPPAVTENKQYYRFITCGFIHADFAHLLFNMFSLYLFGDLVENQFKSIFGESGKILYLVMYVLALVVSLLPTYFKNKNNQYYRSLGASGAVSAVVFAGLMMAPYLKVGLFIIPPIIPGFVFGPLYLVVSAWLDRKGGDNINHSAHIWGALFGVAFLIIVGYLSGGRYDAIQTFIEGVRYYFRS